MAYLRVSSAAQTSAMQRRSISEAAAARGVTISHWYSDRMSGGTTARPGLAALRDAARAGQFAELYVYRLDRLTRTGIRDTLGLLEELRSHGVRVRSIADSFDVGEGGPAHDVVLAVLAWAAKMERLAINERIAGARARVEAEGGAWGRPPRMTGDVRVRAATLASEGKSVRAIAVALKVPRATVHRALQAMSQKHARAGARPTGRKPRAK